MTLHYAFEPGEKVRWPMTQMPAEGNERSVEIEDAMTTRYKTGRYYIRYLYKDLVDRMVEDMQTNVDEAFDNILTITGGEGTGKSNLAHYIAKRFDPDFDQSKSLIYSWSQFLDSVLDDPQKVYWFDEAILVAAGRDWMKEANKMLMSCLQIIRSKRFTIIFCVPKFDNIDVYIREFRTRYMIKAQMMQWTKDSAAVRGYGELFVPKTETERKSLPKDASAEEFFRSVGFFRFPKMESENDESYNRMKEQGQLDELRRMREEIRDKGTSRYKRDKESLSALISHMADVQGMSYQEIADIAKMPYNTVKGIAWRRRNEEDEE